MGRKLIAEPLQMGGTLSVDAEWSPSGSLVFAGQHRWSGDRPSLLPGGSDEYEYYFTVAPEDVPKIAAELGVPVDDREGMLDRLAARAREVVLERGERGWLEQIGIAPTFWSVT